MKVTRILLLTIFVNVCTTILALPPQYYSFYNLNNAAQNICVRDIAQSEDGMMWFAAEGGLYSYDGYHLRKRELAIDGKTLGTDLHVGSFNSIACSGDSLIVGSDKGVLSFNILTNEVHRLNYASDEAVRSVVAVQGRVTVATEKGVYVQGKKLKFEFGSITSIKDGGDCLCIGSNEGAYRYIYNSKKVEKLNTDREFVTCFGCTDMQGIWYGTPHEVIRANRSGDQLTDLFSCSVPVAKVINYDSEGNVLVGTDNGLYIIDNGNSVSRISHDARISESLTGDAVWSIFRDKGDNIWIGTNNGVSMVRNNCAFTAYSLPYITGLGDGNQIFCLCKDSQQRYWLGGSNGLLCIEHLNEEGQAYRWYKMGSKDYPLPHNRVRAIYEDENKHIWMGGDMGLFLYNEENQQFVRCAIPSDENNWVYGISKGPKGMVQVTTYNKRYNVQPNYATFSIDVVDMFEKQSNDNTAAELDSLLRQYSVSEKYLSYYIDTKTATLLFGGTDKFAVLNSSCIINEGMRLGVKVTDVRVNDNYYIDANSIAAASHVFQPKENVIQFYISDFDYANILTDGCMYKLSTDKEWVHLDAKTPIVLYSNLAPGCYTLQIKRSTDLKNENVQDLFTFEVKAPWYDTTLAHIIYILLVLGILYGIYHYIEQRKRLVAERKERAELLAKAKEKEKELLHENDYLSSQLRLQLVAQSGNKEELSPDEQFLLQVTKVIEENMDDSELSVNTLSDKCGVSTKQLYRRIKAITGMTTVAYIRDQRLKKAASLLTTGGFSVSEVMYMVGFSNPSYFTRCFTEEYGIAPSEFKG